MLLSLLCGPSSGFRTEVLEPLRHGRPARYHPFDWAAGNGLAETAVQLDPTDVVLVDGVYSARPELSDLYALTVLVQTPDQTRLARLIARGDDNDEWWSRWDAAEKHYYANVRRPDTYDLVVPGD